MHLQKTRHVAAICCCVTSQWTWKSQLPLLFHLGPCLQSCCLAKQWSNPLKYRYQYEIKISLISFLLIFLVLFCFFFCKYQIHLSVDIYFLVIEELVDSFTTSIVFYKTTHLDIPDNNLHVDKRQSCPCNRSWGLTALWDIEAPTFSRQSTHKWR
jgi:hypothetical protein